MTGAFITVGFVMACAAVAIWMCLTAPEGWQDDDGYHDGREDDQ